jgi:23S rRNA G2445 N2-methylase RlmL
MADPIAFYGQTLPGFEKIAWLELKEKIVGAKLAGYAFAKEQNGILFFEADTTLAQLLQLRTLEDVFLTAFYQQDMSRDWRDLRRIASLITEAQTFDLALQQFRALSNLSGPLTCRMIARKYGQHAFRRKDLEEAIAYGIRHRYGRSLKLTQDDARLEIWVNLLGAELLCGLRLSDRAMRHRDYQARHISAGLRPSAAAAMVLLSKPATDDIFVDTMCGSGTILFERALAGKSKQILGGDMDESRLQAGQTNLAGFSKRKQITIAQWDARHLPLGTAVVTKIVTNPPFGKQMGNSASLHQLYPLMFQEMERILKPGGRIVIISSEYELIKQILRQHPRLRLQTGYSVAILGQWARLYLIDKQV